ncbi:MAG: phytoene/squalene synthase family protein [Candidatus Bruticola sp.]
MYKPDYSSALKESYDWCRQLTAKRARNFYYAIRLLPRARRDAMCAVYAFFRQCDDISDAKNVCCRHEQLEQWKQIVQGQDPPTFMPGLPALRHAVAKYHISPQPFLDLIDGMFMDLEEIHFKTFDDLYLYCYRAASTVGLVCISIFGAPDKPEVYKMAEYHGIAFQLTNILRDINQDASEGRVYIPDEILAKFAITRQSILNRTYNEQKMAQLIEYMAKLAQSYYDRSEFLPYFIPLPSRVCLRAMTNIYHDILNKIESMGTATLRQKARLNLIQKLMAIASAYFVTWADFLRETFLPSN